MVSEISVCYLNGDFVALDEARVSVLDRGFIFGDGVYEVIPVFNGRAFALDEHLQRLTQSLNSIYLTDPLSPAQWTELCLSVIEKNSGGDQSLYIQVTRGVAPRNHVLERAVEATVFVMSSPLTHNREPSGATAITIEDYRWQRCDIKSISLIANVIARQQAASRGASEAIFVREGEITEAAASNVFVVHDDVVITPPLSKQLLAGVTRNLIVKLLAEANLEVCESTISAERLGVVDEVWITSSSREIVPVVSIDDRPVGNGEIGPMFQRALKIYREYKLNF